MKKAGFFLKVLLLHNFIFMDFFMTASLIMLYKQGKDPNTLIKYAVVFYGVEYIVSALIKITKTKTKKNVKSDVDESEE